MKIKFEKTDIQYESLYKYIDIKDSIDNTENIIYPYASKYYRIPSSVPPLGFDIIALNTSNKINTAYNQIENSLREHLEDRIMHFHWEKFYNYLWDHGTFILMGMLFIMLTAYMIMWWLL